ncbi:MAG: thiol-disulfide oxidoreductase DCC family protein [Halobacteriaceae archaeon]
MAAPRLVYDDACDICTRSATFVAAHADVRLVGFADLGPDQRARLPPDWESCAHLLTDEAVYSCGEAMVRAIEYTGLPGTGLFRYCRHLPGWPWLREAGYRLIAANRGRLGCLAN